MKSPRIIEVVVLFISSVWARNITTSFVDVCDNGNQVCSALPSTISVIDIAPLLNNSTELEKSAVRNLIGAACRTWGMFYITNHGLETISKDFEREMKIFFQSSKAVKNSFRRQVDNSRGFADDELTKQKTDLKEIFDVGHKPVRNLPDDAVQNRMLDGFNQWPVGDNLVNFRGIVESYYDVCSDLAATLLSAMSYDLGVSPTILEKSFEEHTSFLRLNYYPVLHQSKNDDVALGINRHTDAGVLTLLFQDSNSALEVYSGSKEDNNDGVWVPVDPIPGCLAINVCDMLQVWSNNEYKAPEHRVRASKESERYSAPFFYNPSYETVVTPIITERTGRREPEYDPISYQYFRQQRFKGDFADTGKEIQIEDFRRN